MKKRVLSMALVLCMVLTLLPVTALAAGTTYEISNGALIINSGNLSTYDNATITGTVSNEAEQLVIDGVTVNLTIENLNVTITGYGGNKSGIALKNGATLNLTVKGTNTLTGDYGGAGINVPQGCTLNITTESTGTLTSTGGNGYGGGAGIGAVGNQWNINNSETVTQSVGTINIAGGTIIAKGGTTTSGWSNITGAAGIGGSTGSKTGDISISGGTVTATGGYASAGIGGAHSGCVNSIKITGGTVTATSGDEGSAIGSGYNGNTSGTLSCGSIEITGGDVTANGNIGYGGAAYSSNNVGGMVSIESGAAVKINGGVISPAAAGVNNYPISVTIYDGRLTSSITNAYITIGGRTYQSTINVSEPYVGTLSCTLAVQGTLSGTQTATVSGGEYCWADISCSQIYGSYSGEIGEKLYPVSLWFYDSAITADITGTILVKRSGTSLNADSTQGIVQLVCDGTIVKQENGTGKMTAWMTAGAQTELSVTAGSLNSGSAITQNDQTILAASSGTIIILRDIEETPQLADPLDLSFGSITFEENGGKLNITYTPTDGGIETTVKGQYYHNEYEIIQTNKDTPTTNQINFQNTTDFVKVKLNGINMSSQGKAIDLLKSKAQLNLLGTNTIDCGGETGNTPAQYYMGIHVAESSAITIDGSGSLTITNPSYYGVGIGGYFNFESNIIEGAGTIRIEGGTITASTKKGTTIGSGYSYNGVNSGNIYITGGNVNVSSSQAGAAIGGGSYGVPASIHISGGTVEATSTGNLCGAAIGGGSKCAAGGIVEISGGRVTATSTGRGAAIGGSDYGATPAIHISGGTVTATNSGGTSYGEIAGAAIGGGARCAEGGSIEISGGVVNANAIKATAIGGGDGYTNTASICPAIIINGGTVTANKIGNGDISSGGSLAITGGTISTASGGKPTINVAANNGSGKSVYYTKVDVNEIYGTSATVTSASITDYTYGFNDVKTDGSGILHLFLPTSGETTKTTANFNGVTYEGSVTSTKPNILKKKIPLQASKGAVTSKGATLYVTADSGNTIYYVASGTALSDGSAVAGADGVQSIVASGGTDTITFSGLTEKTDYTYYLTAKEGNNYSDVEAVTFTTLLVSPNASDVSVDYAGELLKATPGLGYKLEYALAADAETWTEVTTTGVGLTDLLNGHTGPDDIVIYVRKNVSGAVSEAVSVSIPARPDCSVNKLSINYPNETVTIPSSVQYQFATSAPTSWVSATAGTDSAVRLTDKISAAGTAEESLYKVYFRNPATGSAFASKAVTVVIPARPATPAAPSAASVAETDITLTTVTGAEYSKDGKSWQDGTAFSGLAPNTDQTFYQRIKATESSFASLPNSAAITTSKNSIAAATVTLTDCDNFTYDGTEKTPTVTVTLNKTVLDSTQYTVSYSNSNGGAGNHSNAGTVTVTVTASSGGDYSGTVSQTEGMTYTIGKAHLTVTDATVTDRKYDGTKQVYITAVTLDGILNSDDVRVDTSNLTGTLSATDVATYDSVTLPILTIIGTAAGNYTLTQPTVPVPTTVSITKADPLSLTGNATIVKNQANYTVELDLIQISGYPAFPGGTPAFTVTSGSSYNGLTSATVDSGKLTLVADNTANSTQDTITVSITGMDNYADSTITVTVNYTDKIPVIISGLTAKNGTYNGATHIGYIGTPTSGYTGAYEVAYSGRNDTTYSSTSAPVNAGDYTVTLMVPDSDTTYTGSADINFTIGKATVTATADNKSMTTGGALPSFTVSYTGIASGDTADSIFETKATASCTADGKTAGSYDITVSTPVLTSEASNNYIIGTPANGTLTVSNPSIGGGGSTSGKDVTIPVSGNETKVNVSASVTNNTATVSMTDAQIKEITASAETGGIIKLDASALEIDAVVIPDKIISAAGRSSGSISLEVQLPGGAVTLDTSALQSLEGKGDIKLSVETVDSSKLNYNQKEALGTQVESALVVDVNLFAGSTRTSTFGNGKINVSVPYAPKPGENTGSITVWFIKDNGTIEPKNGIYNAATGCVEFTTEHLSQYLIVSFPFSDVAEDAWYYSNVAYAYNNGLFAGTCASTFSPQAAMTRQMIWMVLARMDGKTPTNMDEARAWAMENGISDGSNPTVFITREQMSTILYRYAQYKGYDVSIGKDTNMLSYDDSLTISEYAVLAMQWSCVAGLIQGSGNKLMPGGTATRAQVAAMLQRFCLNVVE